MASVGSLAIILSANSQPLIAGLTKAQGALQGFVSAAGSWGITLAESGAKFITDTISISSAAENSQHQFEVLLNSAESAKNVLSGIKGLSKELNFDPSELRQAGRELALFGFASDEIVSSLRVLADVSNATQVPIAALTQKIGFIRDKGVLSSKDLTQLAREGIPIFDQLSKNLNVSKAGVQDLASKGAIGYNDVAQALTDMTKEGGRFVSITEKMGGTLSAKLSVLGGSIKGLFKELGNSLMKELGFGQVFDSFQSIIDGTKNHISSLAPAFHLIGSFFSVGWAVVKEGFADFVNITQPVWDFFSGWGSEWDNAKELAITTFQIIGKAVDVFVESFKLVSGIFGKYMVQPFVYAMGKLGQQVGTFLRTVADVTPSWMGGDVIENIADKMSDGSQKALAFAAGLKQTSQAFVDSAISGDGQRNVDAFFNKLRQGGVNGAEGLKKATHAAGELAKSLGPNEGLLKHAGEIHDSLLTPFETFTKTFQDVTNLVDKGVLSWEDYARSVDKAMDGALKASNLGVAKFSSAAEKGSKEAVQSIIESQNKAPEDSMLDRIRRVLDDDRKTQLRNEKKLSDIREALVQLGIADLKGG